ncbi:hypothetical protein RRG08_022957 [Elysia crispata]|uniref:G protein-coupled receptor n=1 Tax=Elysia crispata TaxID=231223 RepID=A0AAE1AEB4_9GAST|nr:hypothetical protein RRG08_022957 [Elysia crispata]
MDGDEPLKLGVLFDAMAQKVPFNISMNEARIFSGVLIGVATLDLAATCFLLIITYVTTAMDGMKTCEKLLIYNLLLPDLLLEFLILYIFGPATWHMHWFQGVRDTMWLAFLHTFCIFHAHLATATICYVVALSMTDAYIFEMANNMKHMSVVVISTLTVSVSFCSLPATEDEGYGLQPNWLSPSFNVHFQYGSKFMCAGFVGVAALVELQSIRKLLEARKFYQENISHLTKKAFEEVEKEVVYCILSITTVFMAIPVIIGMPDAFLMFVPRLMVYACPLIRVVVLLNNCPHFQFAFFAQQDGQNFVVLEALEKELHVDKPTPMPVQPSPQTLMEETASGIHLTTEL